MIEDAFRGEVEEDWLRRLMEGVLRFQGVKGPLELSLVIAGDELVHRLNKDYRGVDSTTDVLSFALEEGEASIPFTMPADGVRYLGEVVLSYPQAVRQAQEQQHPVERELALLIVHGVLHLLGCGHEDEGEEQRMRTLEREILERLWCS